MIQKAERNNRTITFSWPYFNTTANRKINVTLDAIFYKDWLKLASKTASTSAWICEDFNEV
jgi:hypothetical protein